MDSQYPTQAAQDVPREIATLHRTLRTIEDKLDNLRRKVQVIEKNMLDSDKKLFSDMKLNASEVSDMKHELEDFKDKMRLIVKELKLSATKEEFAVLQKYMSYFEPLNFVTKKDLDRQIDYKLEEKARE